MLSIATLVLLAATLILGLMYKREKDLRGIAEERNAESKSMLAMSQESINRLQGLIDDRNKENTAILAIRNSGNHDVVREFMDGVFDSGAQGSGPASVPEDPSTTGS